jgi:hypothetical protein
MPRRRSQPSLPRQEDEAIQGCLSPTSQSMQFPFPVGRVERPVLVPPIPFSGARPLLDQTGQEVPRSVRDLQALAVELLLLGVSHPGSFDQTLQHNIAANAGKKHGASDKSYADLADKSGDDDPYTVKQRVMRGRRRQKALRETMREIQNIAALAKTDAGKVVPPEEYERRKEKLLAAFRRVVRTK